MIISAAKTYYLHNEQIPAWLEPDGTDFFSPSLEAADLLQRILPQKEFVTWLNHYYTQRAVDNILQVPVVSDRTDYLIVHLDGLSLSRSWCLRDISRALPAGHKWKKLFMEKANSFLEKALPNIGAGNYGGEHWLASFAINALAD